MIDETKKKKAQKEFASYLSDGLIRKENNDIAKKMYLKNAETSLQVADELMKSSTKPYLWVIVTSYYSMFYIANAVLLSWGYKTQDKIVHKVTNTALIVLVLDKLKKELLENYEEIQNDAMEIASTKAEEIIEGYEQERVKRSSLQYNMTDEVKETKASTSLKRAKEFVFEMKKLLR